MDSVQIATVTAGIDSVIRDQLLDRRQRLREATEYVDHDNEIARLLDEVDAALVRFDGGSFGVCVSCKDAVEPERLLNDPLTQVCLGCLTDKQRASLEDDLQLAAEIQKGLLPRQGIACEKWFVDYAYHPAGIVSGDYVDILERGDEFYFIIGDVSGKGMAASLLMSNLHAIFHSLVPMGLPLKQLMGRANHLLAESSLANQYATLVAGKASRSGEVEISNAGHLPPVLIKNGVKGELVHAGLPLGLFCESEFEVTELRLSSGDCLLLFTDGVTEMLDASGKEFGTERLFAAINGDSSKPGGLIAKCIEELEKFSGGSERHDDLTLLAVNYL